MPEEAIGEVNENRPKPNYTPVISLVTTDFFVGDRNIPNTDTPEVIEMIEIFKLREIPFVLEKLLGPKVLKSLIDEPDEQKSKDIIQGVSYWDESYESHVTWEGLINTQSKESLLVDYLYYMMLKDKSFIFTGTGFILNQDNKSKTVNPAHKMVDVWNEFSRKSRKLSSFLWRTRNDEYGNRQFSVAHNFTRRMNIFGI